MTKKKITSLAPFTCLKCRSTYKRPFEKNILIRKCPNCNGNAILMDVRFRPPKKSDNKQWKKVEFLLKHGFNFQKVYIKNGGEWTREKYPKDLDEAKEFVKKFSDQAIDIGI